MITKEKIPSELKVLENVPKAPTLKPPGAKMFAAATGKSLYTPSGSKVPPAWTDVWIAKDTASRIQATGYDSKGRRVYLYSAEYMGRSSAAKFSRLKAFAKAYPSLIRKIRRDKDNSEEAEVLYLIAKTGFRIGSESETLAETKAFGASTLRCSHVNVNSNTLSFEFTGKKGVQIRKVVRDNFLAGNIAGRCGGNTDQKIFKTSDDEIRKYLNSLPKGPGFLVKDFRTYLATLTALRKIQSMPAPRNKSEFKRYRKEVGSAVASELGNSPTIALKSYVPPEVFGPWECGHAAPEDKSRGKGFSYGDSFLECVQYDEEVPVEECRDCDPLERKE